MQNWKVRIIVINHKKVVVVLAFAVLFLLVVLSNNITAPTPTTPWYQVEDWEKEVCSKWGGTQFSGQAAVTSGRKFSFAALTATVQGKRLKTPENFYLYEVAWYIDSFAEDIDYEISLFHPDNAEVFKIVEAGRLVPEAGTTGYQVYNLTQDFTHIKFKYTGGQVVTPIIQVR
ncbi:hypothetical protein KY338_03460 [Candidatus Woesearchaeota archaeon]|nr:hypothetical protein [Candidatus Woesearchaeota archaeon]MBW3005339.1 hypothetical protein [Candidatus Woesearchaeota archaeon]